MGDGDGSGGGDAYCNEHTDCKSCLADPSGLCGWCTDELEYKDGRTGFQCSGFDPETQTADEWSCPAT